MVNKKGQQGKYWIWIAIAVIVVVILFMVFGRGGQTAEESGTLSVDQVDIIPDISVEECLTEIKATNPEMSDQAAQDNCYSIEAVNQNDPGICDQVSEAFRPNCLAQFQ